MTTNDWIQCRPKNVRKNVVLHFVPPSKAGSSRPDTGFREGVAGAEVGATFKVGDGHSDTSNLPEPEVQYRLEEKRRKRAEKKKY